MADRWQTYTFEFKGGLVSNLASLQQGIQAPGSARVLRNFEPAITGGYDRMRGFDKYSPDLVPEYGDIYVQGSGQSGTTLIIANVFATPKVGASLTIAGVTGTYVIASGGVSYDNINKTATLTLTTSLDSSPADKALVSFVSGPGIICGIASWKNTVVACRNGNIYTGTGAGWTKINVPSYGATLIRGGSQTGGTLLVKGLTQIPQPGDTFKIAGVEKVYMVVSTSVYASNGDATLSITPNLASSPANDAAVTWITSNRIRDLGVKRRFAKYQINNVDKLANVDSTNFPFIWDGTTFNVLTKAPTDIKGSEYVVWFKNQLFFAKGDKLVFTAPYTDDDFNPANGAGTIAVGATITGLTVFRDQLIIFCETKIERITGNTLADFVKLPITENIGCVDSDTIQEVGSDIMFLGPDGLRLLSGTDKFGDFSIATVSKVIQNEFTNLIESGTSFASVLVKKKSQYRLFRYNENSTEQGSFGIIGTLLTGIEGEYFGWSETRGIKVFVADSNYFDKEETVVFGNDRGYVFQLEQGSTFDGESIIATCATPFVFINDPNIRKTFYKLVLYTEPTGGMDLDINLRFDFNKQGVIQPETINIKNTSGNTTFYGSPAALYGSVVYVGTFERVLDAQLVGSGFTVSLEIRCDKPVPPFALDSATLEFATFDRR